MLYQLAQINVGRLLAPLDDPRTAGFVEKLDPVNALADQAPGFVWRLQSDSGNATDVAYDNDPMMVVNISVWENAEVLKRFVYADDHLAVWKERAKWFEKMKLAPACLWWVQAGKMPTVLEARERLETYRRLGPTAFAFWFQKLFPMPVNSDV